MRSRSGAIHSESEEEYMMLANECQDKTGLFYDDKLNSEVWKNLPKQQQSNQSHHNLFKDFDFREEDQFERDQKQLERISGNRNVTNIIICDNTHLICNLLNNSTDSQLSPRSIDYIMRQRTIEKQCINFKYWVVEESIIKSPMAQVYLSKSVNCFWCSSQNCEISLALRISVDELHEALISSETHFFSHQ